MENRQTVFGCQSQGNIASVLLDHAQIVLDSGIIVARNILLIVTILCHLLLLTSPSIRSYLKTRNIVPPVSHQVGDIAHAFLAKRMGDFRLPGSLLRFLHRFLCIARLGDSVDHEFAELE